VLTVPDLSTLFAAHRRINADPTGKTSGKRLSKADVDRLRRLMAEAEAQGDEWPTA
jgi:hypothetical protein